MKILAVSRRFPPDSFGGGEISAHQWCQLLAKEHEVHVLTTGTGQVEENKITIHRQIPPIKSAMPLDIHNNEGFYLSAYKAIKPILKKENFDIIHAFNMASIPPSVSWAKKKSIPIVATVNDHWGTCFFRSHFHEGKVWEVCTTPIIRRNLKRNGISYLTLPYVIYTMRFRKRAMLRCDKLIAVSSWVKRILDANGFRDVEIINNPVDLGTFKTQELRSTGRVLFIGRLDEGKGIETLIKAAAQSQKEIKFKLVFAGTGKENLYKQLSIRQNISADFLGKVDHSDVPEVIYNSDLVVVPFERVEAFPRAVSEACACGRAVITTNISGSVDIIEHAKNGLIIPPQDPKSLARAIIELMSDKSKLKAMGLAGRSIVERKLNQDILLDRLLNVYENVLGIDNS